MSVPPEHVLEPLKGGRFCFGCGPEVSCFTACCAKLHLVLTPYDLLRLSRRVGLRTTDFLERYTTAVEERGKLSRVALMMGDDEGKCPFVTAEGCSVYEDRPGACRAYPLARASSASSAPTRRVNEAYFVVREAHCQGFDEPREWSVEEWIGDQGLEEYNKLNDLWAEILTKQSLVLSGEDAERKARMFNLASYDLDGFRDFVFQSSLLERFEFPPRLLERLKTDDVELLRFAFSWMRLALFGEMTSGLMGR